VRRSTKGSVELDPASCPICESPLRAEIERLDSLWKVPETVKWARQQGLNISKFTIFKHRANHLDPVISGDNGNKGNNDDPTSDAPTTGLGDVKTSQPPKAEPRPIRRSAAKRISRKSPEADNPVESQTTDKAVPPPAQETTIATETMTDQLLLDAVRDRVYRKLLNNEIELDLGDGFKAIEIKHKIAEESQNEKLLLEILSEIRAEELKK
jgi:hypothetical protein